MPDLLRLLRVCRARVRALFHRNAVADEIREELEFHLRMRAEGYERGGEAPDEPERHARKRLGNVTVLQDRGYDVRGGGFIESVLQDVRYGVRQLTLLEDSDRASGEPHSSTPAATRSISTVPRWVTRW